MAESSAFTTELPPQSARIPANDIGVSLPWRPGKGRKKPRILRTSGIWDAGATHTTSDLSLVQQLRLQQIDPCQVRTAQGTRTSGSYLANVYLPNNVLFDGIPVIDGTILDGSQDGGKVLIGMDIISKGDLAITDFQNRLMFSFRVPSQKSISFLEKCCGKP